MADNSNIVNTVRNYASTQFNKRIPKATVDNVSTIGQIILGNKQLRNEFTSILMDTICKTMVTTRKAINPLNIFKDKAKQFGNGIENMYVNPAKAKKFTYDTSSLLTITKPDIKAEIYEIGREDQYQSVINVAKLKRAFLNEGGLSSLINSVYMSLTNGDTLDEYLLSKLLLKLALKNNHVVYQEYVFADPNNPTKAELEQLAIDIQTDSLNMTFTNDTYNKYHEIFKDKDNGDEVLTSTPQEMQVIILRSDYIVKYTMQYLATLFNMTLAEFKAKTIIPVDNFLDAPIIGVLCDYSFLQFYDNIVDEDSFYDKTTLGTKMIRTHMETMAYCTFVNCKFYTYKTDDESWKTSSTGITESTQLPSGEGA